MSKLRPELRWFVKRMEEELKKNEDKGGWSDEDYLFLLRRAKDNLREITISHIFTSDPKNIKELYVIKCCVDCANFCMMIADNLRNLIEEKELG